MSSIQRRQERYKIIYCHKILENIVPNPGLVWKSEEATGRVIIEKKCTEGKYIKQMESSFQITGPKLYNTLPAYLRDMEGQGVEKFKSQLDVYLENIPDQPKTTSLTPRTKKSR